MRRFESKNFFELQKNQLDASQHVLDSYYRLIQNLTYYNVLFIWLISHTRMNNSVYFVFKSCTKEINRIYPKKSV